MIRRCSILPASDDAGYVGEAVVKGDMNLFDCRRNETFAGRELARSHAPSGRVPKFVWQLRLSIYCVFELATWVPHAGLDAVLCDRNGLGVDIEEPNYKH